jgi:hypothetical protein
MALGSTRKLATEAELDAAQRWLSENPEVLQGLENQWAAVWEGKLIAHGPSYGDVVDEARRHGYEDPLMVPVMPYPWV